MMRGFSLLELVIVMALMAIAAAAVWPSAEKTLDAWRHKTEREAAIAAVHLLPINVRRSGKSVELAAGERFPPEQVALPDGTTLTALSAIRIHPDGHCDAGKARLEVGGRIRDMAIAAPYCRATWSDE